MSRPGVFRLSHRLAGLFHLTVVSFGSFEEGQSEVRFEAVDLDHQGGLVDAEVSGCFGEGGVGPGCQEAGEPLSCVWADQRFVEDSGKRLGFVDGAEGGLVAGSATWPEGIIMAIDNYPTLADLTREALRPTRGTAANPQ